MMTGSTRTVGHAARTVQWFASAGYAPYKIDSSAQLNGIDTINRAITLGGDYQPSETWRLGAAVSYSRGSTEFGNDSGGFETQLTSVGAYARKSYARVYTFISGGYGQFEAWGSGGRCEGVLTISALGPQNAQSHQCRRFRRVR
jgi:hypothetical protein